MSYKKVRFIVYKTYFPTFYRIKYYSKIVLRTPGVSQSALRAIKSKQRVDPPLYANQLDSETKTYANQPKVDDKGSDNCDVDDSDNEDETCVWEHWSGFGSCKRINEKGKRVLEHPLET